MELGADVVKVNLPENTPDTVGKTPAPYKDQDYSEEEAVTRVVEAAGKTLVLVSGGTRIDEESVVEKARLSVRCGATGIIFGRNIWQRPWDEAIELTHRIQRIMLEESGVLALAGAR